MILFDGMAPVAAIALVCITLIAMAVTYAMYRHGRILDEANARSSHVGQIPKAGGLAIVIGFILAIAVATWHEPNRALLTSMPWLVTIAAALIIAFISFIDDIKELSAKLRLLIHIAMTLLVVLSGVHIDELSWFNEEPVPISPMFGILVTLVWIIGLTNAVNFMDGIDGLVAASTIVAALAFALINVSVGNDLLAFFSLTIAAATLGFLYYNWSPAKIFMGDVGSAFLGFWFACMALLAANSASVTIDFWVMPLLLFHLIFDTSLTLIRRAMRGENILNAHREHLYQLLVRTGLSHRQVTGIAIGFCLLQAGAAMYMLSLPVALRIWVFLPFIMLQSVYAYWVLTRAKTQQL